MCEIKNMSHLYGVCRKYFLYKKYLSNDYYLINVYFIQNLLQKTQLMLNKLITFD